MIRQIAGFALLAALCAAPAAAEDRAVVIAQPGPGAPLDISQIAARLKAAGMTTTTASDLKAAQLPGPLEVLQAPDPAAGARLVLLSGRFVNAGGDSWLMASDAGARGLAFADRDGISVGHLVTLMRDGSRRGVLLLAETPGGPAPGPRLQAGVGQMRGVAGVSVIAGPPDAIARAVEGLTGPRTNVAAVLLAEPTLRLVSGTAAASLEGSPSAAAAAPTATPTGAGGLTAPALPGEAEAWVRAAALRQVKAYEDFLTAFPNGRYAGVAAQRITQLGGTPPAQASTPATTTSAAPAQGSDSAHAAVAEIALNLSLGERSQLQRILTGLGFDTRGTDGAFGSGTREAIRRWQGGAGLPATGYLDAAQVARLRRSAR
ncbi:peptidoglycan-binding protein [Paracoccus suum]|uniref:Peptidoglycan-binding protein n=1 Tax=Paracoccus suum TaxID=2259340 RepID=A0A344PHV8_9RHOB|nr:peptidoglycan-binding domain-containing protein [Paracoccus suum]AXC48963.1 peptidoglycan-binding protein [Paracoccus suum]